MPTLSESDVLTLAEVASRRAELDVAVAAIAIRPLTELERQELREALAELLSERGLDDRDEPNEFGLHVERLIDLLGQF